MQGEHLHERVNPAGFRYRIRCFRDAPGCSQVGDRTDEHTWFTGYAWCVSHCRRCGLHLGWHFLAKDGGALFGLIADRLRTESDRATGD